MRIKSLIAITCAFFFILVCYELYSGFFHFRQNMYTKAKDTADVFIAFRNWNAQTGSVYVSSDKVAPDPYISDKESIITSGGKTLIKINPTYMTHLVSNQMIKSQGTNVRMISNHALSKAGAPSGWEKDGLKFISRTDKEYYFVDFKSPKNIIFRYVRPITATGQCIGCHTTQNYKPGMVIGGISVSFPVTSEHNKEFLITLIKIFTYLVSAFLVIMLILTSRRKLVTAWEEKLHTINELEKEIKLREMSEKALISQTRSSSISEILSLVAHHWRQPLNNVGLIVQTMASEDDINEVRKYGDTAIEIVKEMSETISLFTSTIKADKSGRLEVKSMVFDTLKLLKPEFDSAGIEVDIKCALGGKPDTPAMTGDDNVYFFCGGKHLECDRSCGFSDIRIEGDEATFKQILLIILKNAYDAVTELPPEKEKVISLTFSRNGSFARVSICDSGNPIPDDVKQRLFDPYFTTKGYQAGKGIGLFTAKSLTANFHNARLFYDDSKGKCFIFEFRDCG